MPIKVHGYKAISLISDPDENYATVRIKILSGINLAKKDIFGASDPYIHISLLTEWNKFIDSVKTKVCRRTLNPEWDVEFFFRVIQDKCKLVFEVFDANRLTRDDFLGRLVVFTNIVPLEQNGPWPYVNLTLRPRSAKSKVKGHLRMSVGYLRERETEYDAVRDGMTALAEEVVREMRELDEQAAATSNETSEEDAASTSSASLSSTASSMSRTDTPPLPPGWEERTDHNGRTVYVDHINRRTQWERPTLAASNTTPSGGAASHRRAEAMAATEFRQRRHISQDDSNDQLRSAFGSGLSVRAGGDDLFMTESGDSVENTINIEASTPQVPPVPVTDWSVIERALEMGLANPEEVPLPSGWTMKMTRSGRIFFINHSTKTTTWNDPRTHTPSPRVGHHPDHHHHDQITAGMNEGEQEGFIRPRSLTDDLDPLPAGWEERVHTDGRVFYIDHNNKFTQWEDPRLSDPKVAGQALPYSRDYNRKYDYFKSRLPKQSTTPSKFAFRVRRAHVFEDSFKAIYRDIQQMELLRTNLWIEFDGEVGLDYGGVAREWFFLLSREMFNPYYGLFEYSATDNYTLQINANSGLCSEDHLAYFRFIGRVSGMAVYHGKLLEAFFIRPFYKMLLGKPMALKDMESVDSEYYNSLVWIMENDPTELDLRFAVDEENFGQMATKELKDGGNEIVVTDENKVEYIQLVMQWRFVDRIKPQMNAFCDGFNDVVPLALLQIFDENEVELLMCGLGDIDVKDWRDHAVYKGEYFVNHKVIQWFWKLVLSMNNEMRARLLQFVTGTSRVPMNGFKELYGSSGPQLFTIEKWGKPSDLPRSHTCFNRLDLPPYEEYEDLRDNLLFAVENAQGFEFS